MRFRSNEILLSVDDFLNILLVRFHAFSGARWCANGGKAASAGGKNILFFDCSALRVLAEPSQLRRISREIRVNRRGKFFALNKTFSQALVVETYPLGRRIRFWHSATENVCAKKYA